MNASASFLSSLGFRLYLIISLTLYYLTWFVHFSLDKVSSFVAIVPTSLKCISKLGKEFSKSNEMSQYGDMPCLWYLISKYQIWCFNVFANHYIPFLFTFQSVCQLFWEQDCVSQPVQSFLTSYFVILRFIFWGFQKLFKQSYLLVCDISTIWFDRCPESVEKTNKYTNKKPIALDNSWISL